jgi:hypothetical protein
MERLISHGILLAIVTAIMVWSLVMQRKAMAQQKKAMDTQREAVDRQKKALIDVEESLALTRKQVENQERIIAILEQIRNGKA